MSDGQPKPRGNPAPPPPPSRPAPPPYSPDKKLIGYIEKGQNPPAEKRG